MNPQIAADGHAHSHQADGSPQSGSELGTSDNQSKPGAPGIQKTTMEVRDLLSVLSAQGIERQLIRLTGVMGASVNPVSGSATITYDPTRTGPTEIMSAIEACGHHCAGNLYRDSSAMRSRQRNDRTHPPRLEPPTVPMPTTRMQWRTRWVTAPAWI